MIMAVLTALALVACGNSDKAPEETTVGTYEADAFEIQTPHCVLKYPNKWKAGVDVAVDTVEGNTVVTFRAANSELVLFDLTFGGGDGYLLGTLQLAEGSVPVHINNRELAATEPGYAEYCEMQNDVNVIINHLSTDYDFVLGT